MDVIKPKVLKSNNIMNNIYTLFFIYKAPLLKYLLYLRFN